jgi:hypothetical protein
MHVHSFPLAADLPVIRRGKLRATVSRRSSSVCRKFALPRVREFVRDGSTVPRNPG